MTYRKLACAYHECANPLHLKNPIATGSGRYWDLCLEHLVSASILRSAGQAVSRVCSTSHCGWPALYAGLCARCMAREAEARYQEDKERRTLFTCALCGEYADDDERDSSDEPPGWVHDRRCCAGVVREWRDEIAAHLDAPEHKEEMSQRGQCFICREPALGLGTSNLPLYAYPYCGKHQWPADWKFCIRGECYAWISQEVTLCALHGGKDYTPRTEP